MKKQYLFIVIIMTAFTMAFTGGQENKAKKDKGEFKFLTEQLGDAKILRYQVPGFEKLSLQQKELIYFLSQAALCGRDITYDQNCRYNLLIRKTLEAIYADYKGDRNGADFLKFHEYLKKVWFNNGIHHHYSTDKFFPDFSKEYFGKLIRSVKPEHLLLAEKETTDQFITEITSLVYDPTVAPKRVNQTQGEDLVATSACNFYEGVSQKEAETYYTSVRANAVKNNEDTLIAFGLNSKLVKENGKVVEKTWKLGGLYSPAIEKIIFWLQKAAVVAETPAQKTAILKLIEYYQTGDLKTWDEYNIAWVKDLDSQVDFINGFIEVYGDPLAHKGSWESVVNFKDIEATKRTVIISTNAQYFEDHSPIDPKYRKKVVKGVTAKVITVAQLGGESHPTTPIGINLPNAQWIRKEYGSKSVTMDNITYSYDKSSQGNGFLEEFTFSKDEIANQKKYGYVAGNLMTDLHECLGHGSGQLMPGVTGESLKNYHSTIEEARADLFALYYMMDQKMIDLGLVPSVDVAKAEYDSYIRNGLMTQLVRIKPGKTVEEAHMRDRALIAHWVFEKGMEKKIIEKVTRNNKTYFKINDYQGLRDLFGLLLREIQRITSEGDYAGAAAIVEKYAVAVDQDLHKEVLDRYQKLHISPYSGFINPSFVVVKKGETISDVRISYPDDFTIQMLEYSRNFSFLTARSK